MKNVILYIKNDDTPYKTHDSIIRYIHAQIDNSLHYNWNIDDIIVISNFSIEYKCVKNIIPTKLCNYNMWANKFYTLKEIFEDYYQDDVWLHDYDVWQIDKFEFPKFNGMIAGCPYDPHHQNWNGGSLFFSKHSLPLINYICDYYELNEKIISKMDDGRGSKWFSDEIILCDLRNINEVKNLFSSLTPQYNLGMTFFKTRYEYAVKPIKAIHVKLLDTKEKNKFEELSSDFNIIPANLYNIINRYKQ